MEGVQIDGQVERGGNKVEMKRWIRLHNNIWEREAPSAKRDGPSWDGQSYLPRGAELESELY